MEEENFNELEELVDDMGCTINDINSTLSSLRLLLVNRSISDEEKEQVNDIIKRQQEIKEEIMEIIVNNM